MNDIKFKEVFRQIGIDLINEYRERGGFKPIDWLAVNTPEASAFIRSIQLHEKTKKELQGVKQELADFRQEVSDAVLEYYGGYHNASGESLEHFIIIPAPKPDPLVATMKYLDWSDKYADPIRAALDALGFEIREKNDDQPNSN